MTDPHSAAQSISRVHVGDDDFEPGDLTANDAVIPPANRSDHEVIAGHRCIFAVTVHDGIPSWRSRTLDAGLRPRHVTCGNFQDPIDVLVRGADAIPKRRLPVAPGQDCHAVGAWPIAGIDGAQLGPNKNGAGW